MALLFKRRRGRRSRTGDGDASGALDLDRESFDIDIDPDDPILTYFQTASQATDIEMLESLGVESPALEEMKDKNVKLVVPFVAQGELVALLMLGPRRSEQEYSTDDRKLLDSLANPAAHSIRISLLVEQQQAEARIRERFEQDLRLGQDIQKNLLPDRVPEISGWRLNAYYRAAREVGGDFYDFIELPGGQLGIFAGDVTNKGFPAALVMASTMSTLRSAAESITSPGAVLEKANDMIVQTIPRLMFVTCLYGILNPATGLFRFANAGHNLPYLKTPEGIDELHARGMALGMMEGSTYEEAEAVIRPGESFLLHSDGVAEAHDPDGGMFGFPRLKAIMTDNPDPERMIDVVLDELRRFTGPDWEQEDDVTLVSVERLPEASVAVPPATTGEQEEFQKLDEFSVPSEPGTERQVMLRVIEAASGVKIPPSKLERLKTAVAEATMNAIEHGNENRPELPVDVEVLATSETLLVKITDQGGDRPIPEAQTPDLEAKLAGEQKARGWGLFLIKNMVDDMRTNIHASQHTIELEIQLKGDADGK